MQTFRHIVIPSCQNILKWPFILKVFISIYFVILRNFICAFIFYFNCPSVKIWLQFFIKNLSLISIFSSMTNKQFVQFCIVSVEKQVFFLTFKHRGYVGKDCLKNSKRRGEGWEYIIVLFHGWLLKLGCMESFYIILEYLLEGVEELEYLKEWFHIIHYNY